MWIDTYLGPPDFIVTDAGKNFTSKEFTQLATTITATVKTVPGEAHWSIGLVERYHAIIRRVYEIIREELPSLTTDATLQMAVKAVNDTAGPDGLIPTLLVFGAYPRLTEYDPPAPSVAQRAAALKKATTEVRRLFAQRQTADALNTRNGPSSTAVLNLPINSDVLVWREGNTGKTGNWEGPYKLLAVDGESCTISISNKPTVFRTTVVKPYHKDPSAPVDDTVSTEPVEHVDIRIPPPPSVVISNRIPSISKQRDNHLQVITSFITRAVFDYIAENDNADEAQAFGPNNKEQGAGGTNVYAESRAKEVDGLLEREVFEFVDEDSVPKGTRIFKLRFVDEIKNRNTPQAFPKSRLVVQAYNDPEKHHVLTQAPTLQRCSERLLLSIAASTKSTHDSKIYLRDITQAYVQSDTNLNRDFYVRPPEELAKRIPQGKLLKVKKPLYGVPEAGNHFYAYHQKFLKEKLHMRPSTYDPCLLHNEDSKDGFGVCTGR